MLHGLIAVDDPCCLYCNSNCMIASENDTFPVGILSVDTYECLKCRENFSVPSLNDQIIGFGFSCNGLQVYFEYKKATMGIRDKSVNVSGPLIEIPKFDIFFDDKEKLYNKLKTYLTFS